MSFAVFDGMARAVLAASLPVLDGVGAGELDELGEQEGANIVVVEFHKHSERIVIVEALLMLEDCTVEVVGLSSRVAFTSDSHPSTSLNAAEAHAAISMTFAKATCFGIALLCS